jgi:hypothetical protein
MHDLKEIIDINERAARVKPCEDNHSRECSYQGDAVTGIILHSARLRNTGFLRGDQKNPGRSPAGRFLAKWLGTTDTGKRNHLVESYFE